MSFKIKRNISQETHPCMLNYERPGEKGREKNKIKKM